jgi:acyl dehydratase
MVDLPAMPGTGTVYRRAIAASMRRHRRQELPDETYRVADVVVDVERLAAYNRVCGFRLTDGLPATYPHVLAFPLAMHLMSGPDFPFPVVGLVHIANRITTVANAVVGERFTLAVQSKDLRDHDRGQQFDIVATATVDGLEVWRGVSTYLRRSGGSASSNRAGGTAGGTTQWRVERGTGKAYAAVSGDRNPIHTSRLGAKAFGFPGPIAHGMWSLARCLAAMEGRLPEAYSVDVAFKRPIPLPSTVAFSTSGDEFDLVSARTGAPHLHGSIRAR